MIFGARWKLHLFLLCLSKVKMLLTDRTNDRAPAARPAYLGLRVWARCSICPPIRVSQRISQRSSKPASSESTEELVSALASERDNNEQLERQLQDVLAMWERESIQARLRWRRP